MAFASYRGFRLVTPQTSPKGVYQHESDGQAAKIALAVILLVADLFHPIDHLAVNALLDRDVSHGRRGCGSMPMLLAQREPHDIAGPDLLDRSHLRAEPNRSPV